MRETIDNYINSIQDNYPLPAEYEQFSSMQDKLGLPDPFDVLPVQVRSANKLVNMQVNCFGPNTFAARNWRNWYSRIGGMHNGSDFIVETGTPLLAVADGVVIRSWPFMGDPKDKSIVLWPFLPDRFKDAQGRRVMSNILVAYGHMSNNSMHAEGAVLKAGDVIGLSGTPGGSGFNDHLHFEVHLLTGDKGFLNLRALGARKLLAKFNRAQPYSNQMPWNTLLFYSKRLVKYQVHQSRVIGYNGMPSYPTFDMLRNLNASHLGPLDEFAVAYWEYPKAGTAVCWEPQTPAFPRGVVTMKDLPARLANFESFQPFDNPFAK